MAKEKARTKIGAEHVGAFLRQGLAELRGALYNESNVAQPPQYGLYGTKTPGEVMVDRRPDKCDPDEQHKSILDESLQQAERDRDGREPEPPSLEKE